MSKVPDEEMEKLRKQLEMLPSIDESLKQLTEKVNKVLTSDGEELSAESQAYRLNALADAEGHRLGREFAQFTQKHSLSFIRTVAQTILIGSVSQLGISNFYRSIQGGGTPWRFIVIVIASALVIFGIGSNPVYSTGISEWLGRGYNSYIILIFLVVIALIYAVANRRRNSPKGAAVGGV